jgi:hypothetical protein
VDEECSETAAHLVDSVFPHVPVRQWVTFIQRFGSALNLNLHLHSLMLDGVYAADDEGHQGAFFACARRRGMAAPRRRPRKVDLS